MRGREEEEEEEEGGNFKLQVVFFSVNTLFNFIFCK